MEKNARSTIKNMQFIETRENSTDTCTTGKDIIFIKYPLCAIKSIRIPILNFTLLNRFNTGTFNLFF